MFSVHVQLRPSSSVGTVTSIREADAGAAMDARWRTAPNGCTKRRVSNTGVLGLSQKRSCPNCASHRTTLCV